MRGLLEKTCFEQVASGGKAAGEKNGGGEERGRVLARLLGWQHTLGNTLSRGQT